MYTQCPECGTVFRVTAAVLRAAQAQVRCGVCDANFNALRFLADDLEAGVTPPGGGAISSEPPESQPALEPRAEPMSALAPAAAGTPVPHAAPAAGKDPTDEPGWQPVLALAAAPAAEPDPAQDVAPEPEWQPAPDPWRHGATRTTPSADEERASAELAAIAAAAALAPAQRAEHYNILEPDDVAELLIDDPEPPVDDAAGSAALEFNPPDAEWERIFVDADVATPTSALDLSLIPTAADPGDTGQETLLLATEPEVEPDLSFELGPEAAPQAAPEPAAEAIWDAPPGVSHPVLDALPSSEPELVLRWIDEERAAESAAATQDLPAATPVAQHDSAAQTARADAAPSEEEFDVELDLDAALAAVQGSASPPDDDDPLACTDEFPLPDFAGLTDSADSTEPAQGADGVESEYAHEEPSDGPVDILLAPAPPERRPADATPAAAAEAFEDASKVEHIVLGGDESMFSTDAFRSRRTGAPRAARPKVAPLAVAAVVALLLALAGQWLHHARETLIDTPILGAPLAALYRTLGVPVEPRWNLGAYEVRQWGAGSDAAPGTLRLRASIVNRADRAQPYPLLRVVLEDRYGGAVARREFRPVEYLPGREAPTTPLSAGARADADLRLVDPGSDVVGFELDVCLEHQGALICGADPRPPGG